MSNSEDGPATATIREGKQQEGPAISAIAGAPTDELRRTKDQLHQSQIPQRKRLAEAVRKTRCRVGARRSRSENKSTAARRFDVVVKSEEKMGLEIEGADGNRNGSSTGIGRARVKKVHRRHRCARGSNRNDDVHVRAGDILVAVGGARLAGRNLADVVRLLASAPRPMTVTFERPLAGEEEELDVGVGEHSDGDANGDDSSSGRRRMKRRKIRDGDAAGVPGKTGGGDDGVAEVVMFRSYRKTSTSASTQSQATRITELTDERDELRRLVDRLEMENAELSNERDDLRGRIDSLSNEAMYSYARLGENILEREEVREEPPSFSTEQRGRIADFISRVRRQEAVERERVERLLEATNMASTKVVKDYEGAVRERHEETRKRKDLERQLLKMERSISAEQRKLWFAPKREKKKKMTNEGDSTPFKESAYRDKKSHLIDNNNFFTKETCQILAESLEARNKGNKLKIAKDELKVAGRIISLGFKASKDDIPRIELPSCSHSRHFTVARVPRARVSTTEVLNKSSKSRRRMALAWMDLLPENVIEGAMDDFFRRHPAAVDRLLKEYRAAHRRLSAEETSIVLAYVGDVSQRQYERFMQGFDCYFGERVFCPKGTLARWREDHPRTDCSEIGKRVIGNFTKRQFKTRPPKGEENDERTSDREDG